jgi:hypothetical protein
MIGLLPKVLTLENTKCLSLTDGAKRFGLPVTLMQDGTANIKERFVSRAFIAIRSLMRIIKATQKH